MRPSTIILFIGGHYLIMSYIIETFKIIRNYKVNKKGKKINKLKRGKRKIVLEMASRDKKHTRKHYLIMNFIIETFKFINNSMLTDVITAIKKCFCVKAD